MAQDGFAKDYAEKLTSPAEAVRLALLVASAVLMLANLGLIFLCLYIFVIDKRSSSTN